MYKILKAETLAAKIHLMVVHAPRVASHCQPGQFIIVKMDEKGETNSAYHLRLRSRRRNHYHRVPGSRSIHN